MPFGPVQGKTTTKGDTVFEVQGLQPREGGREGGRESG